MITHDNLIRLAKIWVVGKIPEASFTLQTDSRKLMDENLFLCLKGENFDAFDYIENIAKSESIRAIIFEDGMGRKELVERLSKSFPHVAFISVIDSLLALQDLAAHRRKAWQAAGGKVYALTGSNGKTTTKEMLAHFLKAIFHDEVLVTKGNLNNHIGVPLTLLSLEDHHKVAVIEMGTNHSGEIELLAKIAAPIYGLITNIGAAHIEFLGGLEGVFEEKGALFRSIDNLNVEDKCFVVNNDDDYLHLLPTDSWITRASFGNNCKDSFDFKMNDEFIELTCPAVFERHNRRNMMLAYSLVASTVQGAREKLSEAAKTFRLPQNNRSQGLLVDKCFIYLDAYNANPSSMKASLESFAERSQNEGRSFEEILLILGDMNEIGVESKKYHQEIAACAFELGFRHLVAIGRFADYYRESFKGETKVFTSTIEAKSYVQDALKNQQAVFIKGSRSLQLESLLDIK